MESPITDNQHWHLVKTGGSQIVLTPEELWERATGYFAWCDANPIKTKRPLTSGKNAGTMTTVEHVRLYTIEAFCIHANISKKYIKDISDSGDETSAYYHVMMKVLLIIYTQNLEGAAADIYNPIIVSKILALDKQDAPKDGNVKVEIVNSISGKLANSENEVLQNLDFEKVSLVKDKSTDLQRENSERENHIHESVDGTTD